MTTIKSLSLIAFTLIGAFALSAGYYPMTPIKSTPVASWSPQSEGDCIYAYEYFRSLTTDGSGNITSVPNQCSGGSAIAAATNGVNATPYSATGGPSSSGAATYDGGTILQGGSATTNILGASQAFTQCHVGKFIGFVTQNITGEWRVAGGNTAYFYYANGGTSHWGWGGSQTSLVGSKFNRSSDSTTFHKVCLMYNGSGVGTNTNYTLYVDGTTYTSDAVDSENGSSDSVFGNYKNGTDSSFRSRMTASGHWYWNHVLDATGLSNWSSYITTQIGL